MRLLPLPDGPDSGQAFAADLFGSVPSGPVEGESEGELMDSDTRKMEQAGEKLVQALDVTAFWLDNMIQGGSGHPVPEVVFRMVREAKRAWKDGQTNHTRVVTNFLTFGISMLRFSL